MISLFEALTLTPNAGRCFSNMRPMFMQCIKNVFEISFLNYLIIKLRIIDVEASIAEQNMVFTELVVML